MSLAYNSYFTTLLEDDMKFYMPSTAGLVTTATGSHQQQSLGPQNVPILTNILPNYYNTTTTINNSILPSTSSSSRTSKTNLYIKGLTAEFTDERLKSLVPQPSLVKSVKAATDDGVTCKGYGFIDFVTEDAALAAQKHIHDKYSTYTVKFAKENEKDSTNLYVTNLPPTWKGKKDEDRLKELFESFGAIQSVHIQTDPTSTRSSGVGFVRFTTEEGAKKALEVLKTQPRYLDGSPQPLQAKYADKHNPATRARRNPQVSPAAVGGKIRAYMVPTMGAGSPLSPYHSLLLRSSTAYPYGPASAFYAANNTTAAPLPLTTLTASAEHAVSSLVRPSGSVNAYAMSNPYLAATTIIPTGSAAAGLAAAVASSVPGSADSSIPTPTVSSANTISMSNPYQTALHQPSLAFQHPFLSAAAAAVAPNSGASYAYLAVGGVVPRYVPVEYAPGGLYASTSATCNDQSQIQS